MKDTANFDGINRPVTRIGRSRGCYRTLFSRPERRRRTSRGGPDQARVVAFTDGKEAWKGLKLAILEVSTISLAVAASTIMSNPPSNAWQMAGRSRNPNAASRTPQMRSGTQSPAQQAAPSQPPRQETSRGQQPAPQPSNVWTQRSANPNTSNGSSKIEALSVAEEAHQPVNGFNATEVKAFLGRDDVAVSSYKLVEGTDAKSGSAWGPKANHMANNQPFFPHLAKQVATNEDGG